MQKLTTLISLLIISLSLNATTVDIFPSGPSCVGQSSSIDINSTFSFNDVMTIYWGDGDSSITIGDAFGESHVYANTNLTGYDVRVKVTDGGTSILFDQTFTLLMVVDDCQTGPATVYDSVNVDLDAKTITPFGELCVGDTIQFNLKDSYPFNQYYITLGYGHLDQFMAPYEDFTYNDGTPLLHVYPDTGWYNITTRVEDDQFALVIDTTYSNAIHISECAAPLCELSASLADSICLSEDTLALNATVSGAVSIAWTQTGGTGNFTAANAASTKFYTSGNNSTVTFTVTASGGSCATDTSISLTVNLAHEMNLLLTPDFSLCESSSYVIKYPGTIPANATWFGADSLVNAAGNSVTFKPLLGARLDGTQQILLGDVTNFCPNSVDTIVATIVSPPYVNAGNDTTITNYELIHLNGTVSGSTTEGVWTSNHPNGIFRNSNFDRDSSDLNGTYANTIQSHSLGKTILTLTSTNNAGCDAVSDSIKIITSGCQVEISQTQEDNKVELQASVQNANMIGKYEWSIGTSSTNGWVEAESVGQSQNFGHTFDAVGVYTVFVGFTPSDLGCFSLDSTAITISSIPVVPLSITGVIEKDGQGILGQVATFLAPADPNRCFGGAFCFDIKEAKSDPLSGYYEMKNISSGTSLGLSAQPLGEFVDLEPDNESRFIITKNEVINWSNTVSQKVNQSKPTAGNDMLKGQITVTFDSINAHVDSLSSIGNFVRVHLVDQNGNQVDSQLADDFGKYEFSNLAAGVYRLEILTDPFTAVQNTNKSDYFVIDGDSTTIHKRSHRVVLKIPEEFLSVITNTFDSQTNSESISISIHPNPSTGNFVITAPEGLLNGQYSMEIISEIGVLVNQDSGTNSSESIVVSKENLDAGIYFIKVRTDKGVFSNKLIIE